MPRLRLRLQLLSCLDWLLFGHKPGKLTAGPDFCFVEDGTLQDFKRCVLKNIGYCHPVFLQFGTADFCMGTVWRGDFAEAAYNRGDVVMVGSNAYQFVHESQPQTLEDAVLISCTGTVAGGWFVPNVQEGGDVITGTVQDDDHCDPEGQRQN